MAENYYDKILKNINDLITSKKIKDALELVKTELNMPYIPLKYEQKFVVLLENLQNELKNKGPQQVIPVEELIKMLFSNSEPQQAISIELLAKSNLRPFLVEIKKRIETWKDPEKQALLFELLHEQNINLELQIGKKTLNPQSYSIFTEDNLLKAMQEIEKLTFKNPQLLEITQALIIQYVMRIFPSPISNPLQLAQDFYALGKHFLKGHELTKKQLALKKILGK